MDEAAAAREPFGAGSRRPVVVGVDGSAHSLAAAELAADEAAGRGCPLEIVHAFDPPVLAGPGGAAPELPPVAPAAEVTVPALREHAERLLHEVAGRVRGRHPDLPVVTRRHDGPPAQVLTEASHHAGLLVVGHRGLGGFAELLVGSVGVQLVNHSACPVVVVRGTPMAEAPVVVGVDGSEGARRAGGFAAQSAGRYGASLVVLYAGPHDPGWAPEQVQAGEPPPQPPAAVTELVTALRERHPALRIEPQLRPGEPAHAALVAASRQARLVVVGARGLGGFRGLLLGSVSQALLHHAGCPVAVIPPARGGGG